MPRIPTPRPSTAIALAALAVAATGPAIAATLITGANVKDGSIQSRDIADGNAGVSSADIKDGSIQLADLSKTARAALEGKAGPAGPAGATGPTGPAGPAGAKGADGTSGVNGASGAAGQSGAAGPSLLTSTGSVDMTSGTNTGISWVRPGSSVGSSNITGAELPIPPGPTVTIRDLAVRTTAAVAGGPATVTLYKNGAPTSLECVVAQGGQTCTSQQTVTVDSGDRVAMRLFGPAVSSSAIMNTVVKFVY